MSTRWDPDNAAAHCFTCHMRFGENPIAFTAWIKKYLGDVRYDELQARHRRIVKRTKHDLEFLYQHLKQQFETLQEDPNHSVVNYE
jgi:hypothetical protein